MLPSEGLDGRVALTSNLSEGQVAIGRTEFDIPRIDFSCSVARVREECITGFNNLKVGDRALSLICDTVSGTASTCVA